MTKISITPRRLSLGLALLMAGAAALAAVRLLWPSAEPAPPATQTVVRGDITVKVLATGEVQALNQVEVGAQVSGQVKTLKVKLGQRVAQGELLAEIDPTLARNDMLAAEASLEGLKAQLRSAQAQLRQAALALARQRTLRDIDASSQQDVETAEAQHIAVQSGIESLGAQLKSAQIGVETLRVKLAQTRIVAPMAGNVIALAVQEGQTVIATQQAPLILRLADLSTVLVKADVSEADVIRVRAGQPAEFSILGDAGRLYRGKVHAVEPAPAGYTGNAAARIAGPVFYSVLFNAANPEGTLRLGMTAQVAIVVGEARAVLQIPLPAVGARRPDGRYEVQVAGRKRIESRAVRLGLSDNRLFEVLSGLEEGEQVVLAPADAPTSTTGTGAFPGIAW